MIEVWLIQTSLHNWTNVVKKKPVNIYCEEKTKAGLYGRMAIMKPILRKQN